MSAPTGIELRYDQYGDGYLYAHIRVGHIEPVMDLYDDEIGYKAVYGHLEAEFCTDASEVDLENAKTWMQDQVDRYGVVPPKPVVTATPVVQFESVTFDGITTVTAYGPSREVLATITECRGTDGVVFGYDADVAGNPDEDAHFACMARDAASALRDAKAHVLVALGVL